MKAYLLWLWKLGFFLGVLWSSPGLMAQDLPDIPDIIRVSVDHSDNGVVIEWEASEDPDVEFYHLYKMNAHQSFEKLFSFSANTLECKHMAAELKNLAYAVTAEDSAHNESLFGDNVHRAVSLNAEFDLCSGSNQLQWTDYDGWDGQIAGYKVYAAGPGEGFQLLDYVHATTNSFPHPASLPDTVYRYYIQAIHTSGIQSLSAIDSVFTLYPEAPEYLQIDQVSVLDRSTAEIHFTADIQGPVTSFRLLRRPNAQTPFSEMETIWNIREGSQRFTDQFATGSLSYQYKVQSVFRPANCEKGIVISESNTGNSILLEYTQQDEQLRLDWNPYESYENGLEAYVLTKNSGDGEFIEIARLSPGSTSWQEDIEVMVNGFQSGLLQYQVMALGYPDAFGERGQSYSNIVDVTLGTRMRIPNAITPESGDIDANFLPQMDFAPRTYVMLVMDRGGRKMFETTDPGRGWNGRFRNGELASEGVYVYYIQYTDHTGITRSHTGNLTLIY